MSERAIGKKLWEVLWDAVEQAGAGLVRLEKRKRKRENREQEHVNSRRTEGGRGRVYGSSTGWHGDLKRPMDCPESRADDQDDTRGHEHGSPPQNQASYTDTDTDTDTGIDDAGNADTPGPND